MSDRIIWQSTITEDMVEGFNENELELLIADLDDAVMATIQDYEVRN